MYIDRSEKGLLNEFVYKAIREKIGSTIILTGEPGIGKTTFITNYFETLSEKEEFKVIKTAIGSCNDIDGVSNSYLPWKEALIELDANFAAAGDNKRKEGFKKIVSSVINENGTDWIKAIPQIGGIGAGVIKAVKAFSKKDKIDIGSGETVGISVTQRIKNAFDEGSTDLLEAIPIVGNLASAIHKTTQTVLKKSDSVILKNQEDFFILVVNKLRKLAESNPLILFFDDLQWADLSSLNLLYYAVKNLNDKTYPLVLVVSYRPQDVKEGRLNTTTGKYDRHPLEEKLNNLARYNAFKSIKLSRFSENQIEKFFAEEYPGNKFTPKFKKEIINITEGNAFFLKETLGNLADTGFIFNESGKFINNKTLDFSSFPKTIEGVIRERYERLPEELQEILEIAAVMGTEFSADLLKGIVDQAEIRFLRNIELLNNKFNIIDTENTVIDKLTQIYKFNHNLVQRYIYYKINREIRANYHKIIAANIRSIYKNEGISNIVTIYSLHFGIGNKIIDENYKLLIAKDNLGKTISNEIVKEFLGYQQDRAEFYEKSYSTEEAINAFEFVIKLSDILDLKDNIIKFSIKKAEMLMILSKWNDSETTLQQIMQMNDVVQLLDRATCMNLMGRLYELKGKYAEALNFLNKALLIFEELHDETGISKVLGNIGMINKNMGEYDTAMDYYNRQLQKCVMLGDLKGIALSTGNIGIINYELGKYDEAIECYSKQISIYEQLNDKSGLSYVLGNMGIICFQKHDHIKSEEYYFRQIKICEEIGDRRGLSRAFGNMGTLKLENNEYDLAEEYFNKQIAICEEIGDAIGLIYSYINKGIICIIRKNFNMAKEHFEKSLKRSTEIGDKKGIDLSTMFLKDVNNEVLH